jgi:hypothetical protein
MTECGSDCIRAQSIHPPCHVGPNHLQMPAGISLSILIARETSIEIGRYPAALLARLLDEALCRGGPLLRITHLDVIPALETAHARVYRTLSKEDLVQILKSLLSKVATSTVPDDPNTTQDLANARLFFVTLSEALKEQRA